MSTAQAVKQQYSDLNSGAMFFNKERKADNHPNHRGRINVDGKWYWLASWTKVSQGQEKYQSLAITEMTQEDVDKYIKKTTPQMSEVNNDDIM